MALRKVTLREQWLGLDRHNITAITEYSVADHTVLLLQKQIPPQDCDV